LTEASADDLAAAFRQHVLCFHRLVQTLFAGMKSSGYGRIINIISTSVVQPIRGLGVSNTTRGAVANWGRTLAGELAPFGITVNNVLPGYTATERLRSLFEVKARHAGKRAEAVQAETVAAIPMRRLADPAEIGAVVAFLASPAASYVTGVNLPVDGGRTAIQ
jgi:3-oxoacyl-[acyl-carrier protein] reductase